MPSKLVTALRRKYKNPKDVLRKLGIDEHLLDGNERPRLVFDARGRSKARDDAPGPRISGSAYKAITEILGEANLGGSEFAELQKRLEMMIDRDLLDEEQEIMEAGDTEVRQANSMSREEAAREQACGSGSDDEGEVREERYRVMAHLANHLQEKGRSEDEIAHVLQDMPVNGLEHLGGALAHDLERLMGNRARYAARDKRKGNKAFDARYPNAVRVQNDRAIEGGVDPALRTAPYRRRVYGRVRGALAGRDAHPRRLEAQAVWERKNDD